MTSFPELLTLVENTNKKYSVYNSGGKKKKSLKKIKIEFLNYYNSDYVIKQQFFLKIYIYIVIIVFKLLYTEDPDLKKDRRIGKCFYWKVACRQTD